MTLIQKIGLLVLAVLLGAGCRGYVAGGPGPAKGTLPGGDGGSGPMGTPADGRLTGAGGRDIMQFWPTLDIPFSANAKMLSFPMMKNEVLRATGRTWTVGGVDQWAVNLSALGGADFATTFTQDITPSQQKLSLWRQMAWQVCQDAVTQDAGSTTRQLFTELDPGAALTLTNPAVSRQVRLLFQRFFLEPATDTEVAQATALLGAVNTEAGNPKEAWRALCVGYLGSMKFLTY